MPNKILLIVEDETALLKLLISKFEEEKYHVLQAQNGKEGLETALKNHPDIILLDILMPVLGGMAMLKELRGDDWGKTVPVILLTNLGDSEKVAEATNYGVYDYLVKADWHVDDVVKKVKEKLLEKK